MDTPRDRVRESIQTLPYTCVTCADAATRARVVTILPDNMAAVEIDGSNAEISLQLCDAGPGDRVLVHAGVALARLKEGASF